MQSTPTPSESPVDQEAVYEPPMLVEIGLFADVTRGADGPYPDYPALSRGYWLI